MKLKYTLAVGALALATATQAQTWIPDTMNMGANYVNNIYYSFENGQVGAVVPETNWHLAVQGISFAVPHHGGAGIWTNEARKNGPAVKLYSLDKNATADFLNITDADTVGKTGSILALHNDTSSYANGAFNAASTSNPFNYGWGNYYMGSAPGGFPDHSVVGDTLFLANLTTSSMGGPATVSKSFVIWPRVLENGNHWVLYYRELGSSDVDTIDISTAGSTTLFKYFNLETGEVVEREPHRESWDFVFTNYMDLYGSQGMQGVTGALQNYNVSVAQIDNIVPNNADYQSVDSTDYSFNLNTIGNDWKYLDGMSWALTQNRSYFVKVFNGDIWQIYFDYFATVAGDRKIGFQKRKVYTKPPPPTGVNEVNAFVGNMLVVPNPSVGGSSNLLIDAKKDIQSAQITIADLSGRVVLKATKNIKAGFQQLRIDVSNYPAGAYMVNLAGAGFSTTQKLVVQ